MSRFKIYRIWKKGMENEYLIKTSGWGEDMINTSVYVYTEYFPFHFLYDE